MIFVTVGTHTDQFDRLIKRIDEIAPKIKEKIIIQRGFTKYVPKNVEFFEFTDDMDHYYKNARIVIAQSATSLIEFILNYGKPVITVPRESKYNEHINYNKKPKINLDGLHDLQNKIRNVIDEI